VHVTAVNRVFESPTIGQFWSLFTDADRAAPDAGITRQPQIIAYIDDFKLLMIATLVLIPLLIVFKRAHERWHDSRWVLAGMWLEFARRDLRSYLIVESDQSLN
jgi:hypothetical protein